MLSTHLIPLTRMPSFYKSALVGCLTLLSCFARAQDAPLGALPTQFNPSFAGEAGSPRASSSLVYRSRQEWQRIPATQMVASYPYRMFQASTAYDQFVPALRSGVGIATSHTSGATPYHTFTAHSVSLAVASKFSVRGKYTFSPSLDVEYGWLRESREAQPGVMWHDDMEAHWIRSRAGLLFNTDKYYVGYSAVVLQGPSWRYPYIGRKSGLYGIYLSHLQVGYTFGSSTGSKFSFTPQLALRIGEGGRYSPHSTRDIGKFRFGDGGIGVEAFNLGFRYKQFLWGVNNVGVHVGWQTERLRVMVTNSLGLVRRADSVPYIGNLSLRYVFKEKR
jgi:hypothetical protein